MKILVIFADMLRPNLLNTFNPEMPVSRLDRKLKELGGTVFTKCYTPAPDTPRSHACLWSSNYPKFNGCDNRLKWPRYYLNDSVPDFLSLLKSEGYELNFFISPNSKATGELPPPP